MKNAVTDASAVDVDQITLGKLSACRNEAAVSGDINTGVGIVVVGLASVIIGTSLFKKVTFFRVTSSVVVGSILYKACVAVAMFAGISPNAIKLITAVLFLIILVISMDRKKVKAC